MHTALQSRLSVAVLRFYGLWKKLVYIYLRFILVILLYFSFFTVHRNLYLKICCVNFNLCICSCEGGKTHLNCEKMNC